MACDQKDPERLKSIERTNARTSSRPCYKSAVSGLRMNQMNSIVGCIKVIILSSDHCKSGKIDKIQNQIREFLSVIEKLRVIWHH